MWFFKINHHVFKTSLFSSHSRCNLSEPEDLKRFKQLKWYFPQCDPGAGCIRNTWGAYQKQIPGHHPKPNELELIGFRNLHLTSSPSDPSTSVFANPWLSCVLRASAHSHRASSPYYLIPRSLSFTLGVSGKEKAGFWSWEIWNQIWLYYFLSRWAGTSYSIFPGLFLHC